MTLRTVRIGQQIYMLLRLILLITVLRYWGFSTNQISACYFSLVVLSTIRAGPEPGAPVEGKNKETKK